MDAISGLPSATGAEPKHPPDRTHSCSGSATLVVDQAADSRKHSEDAQCKN